MKAGNFQPTVQDPIRPIQDFKEKILSRLANDSGFDWALGLVETTGTGGTIELTLTSTGRLKRVGARVGRDTKE